MRICHIVYSCVPGDFRGGTPKTVFELATAQTALGHEVNIITTNFNSSIKTDAYTGYVKQIGSVKIHYFQASFPPYLHSPDMRRELVDDPARYDVLHSHNVFQAPNRYAADARKRSNAVLALSVHGSLNPRYVDKGLYSSLRKRAYIKLFERHNFRLADVVFALTEQEKADIELFISKPVRIEVVPSGINFNLDRIPETSESFRIRYAISRDDFVVLFLGRIVPLKGVHLLIEAVAQLVNKHNVKLLIAGDREQSPSYVTRLESMIAERDLESQVVWTGFLNEDEKWQAFACADVFCNISESEAMSIAVLEALSTGTATVVSVGCNMHAAAKQDALIECDFNAASVTRALEQLLDNPTLRERIGSNGQRYATTNHDWASIAQKSIGVYDSCLRNI